MPMEIEAKFRIGDPQVFPLLLALDRLGPYVLRPAPQHEEQRNTYYDTPDGCLRRARYGLRTREVQGRVIVTLKGPGQVQGGVHERAEWEAEVADPDPSAWPDGEVRCRVRALVTPDVPLVPFLTIHTHRHHIVVLSASHQEVAEVSLDESRIEAGGATDDFCELEIELRPAGTRRDLEALVAALGEHMVLMPEPRSKLERGLALLQEVVHDNDH
ncbi:MAG: CYTH domain-containing protein [Chloroflexaceae bacterium]|nr:CYTH domain-containing protein [Chloroflexaceae bacterium]